MASELENLATLYCPAFMKIGMKGLLSVKTINILQRNRALREWRSSQWIRGWSRNINMCSGPAWNFDHNFSDAVVSGRYTEMADHRG